MADDAALVSLNLIPKHLIRPRLIKAMAAAVVLAVAVGLLLGWLITWWVGLLVGAVIAGPVIGSSLSVLRRDQQMIGTEIVSRSTGTRTVDLAAVPARITGHRGRTSQAVLKCGGQSVVLAVYVGERGRELPIEALAALESALRRAAERNGAPAQTSVSQVEQEGRPATAAELAEVVRAQLRAIAIGAPAAQRPLYRIAHAGGAGPRAIVTVSSELARELAA